MKMTVVSDKDGAIIAAHHGEVKQPDTSVVTPTHLADWQAGLLAGPGQQIHVLDVSDELLNVTSPAELETQLKAALGKHRK